MLISSMNPKVLAQDRLIEDMQHLKTYHRSNSPLFLRDIEVKNYLNYSESQLRPILLLLKIQLNLDTVN